MPGSPPPRTAGVDEARVGRLLGHAGTMTSRYDRPLWDGILHQAVYAWMHDHPVLKPTA
ncbi:hypothetical protein [Actinomadura kijaniata]|uniref:hypothetical protein n=1 Tax=Actinomadura kijaniata TaxID=46161 RepID=UPI000AD90959|nr:hypothetical protein [Actinomadura kijaniata]